MDRQRREIERQIEQLEQQRLLFFGPDVNEHSFILGAITALGWAQMNKDNTSPMVKLEEISLQNMAKGGR